MDLRRTMTAVLVLFSSALTPPAAAGERAAAVQTLETDVIDRAASCSWIMRLLGLCERRP